MVVESHSVEALLDMLEGALQALVPTVRAKVTETAINRMYGFQDEHCRDRVTLAKIKDAFPDVGAKELRKEVVDFLSAWRGARISKDRDHQEGIAADHAESFIRLQKAHGWQPGKQLVSGYELHVSPKVAGNGDLIGSLEQGGR